MSKITATALKKYLRQCSNEQLVEDIVDLFTRLNAVRDYYTLRLQGPNEDLIAEYKARIRREFFPARGYGAARLSVARTAVNDYAKLGPPPASLSDLMLYYVETGVHYTRTYGDITAAFYRSMETMYDRALLLITTHRLGEEFEDRCAQIVANTSHIGWGFHDELSDLYHHYFPQ